MSSALVTTGSAVLSESNFGLVAGANVGFLGNHTSRLNNGTSTLAALIASGVCFVSRLFAPEHGAFGKYDEDVADEVDPASGLTIYSLYGEHRRPTSEMLDGLDYVVFELQDVGARFYTYTATLLATIDSAYACGVKVLVLDRPNPVNGLTSDGPVADPDAYSFVAPYNIPIRHGLTLGEVGLLYASETGKPNTVTVVPAAGWSRSHFFDQTGLQWVSPSPAMRSLDTAIIYSGICLLEQTNVSVGRGTSHPFELIGAPFIDGAAWERALSAEALAGVEFSTTTFRPELSKYEGETCHGVQVHIKDRTTLPSVALGIALLATLRDLYPVQFELDGCDRLLASASTLSRLKAGHNKDQIVNSWQPSLHKWGNRRKACMLYRD